MKSTCRISIHTQQLLLNMIKSLDVFSAVINTIRANKKSFKALDTNSVEHGN